MTCLGCGFRITWREQRRQFGRLLRLGRSKEEASALLPRCQKCVTAKLHFEEVSLCPIR